MNRDKLTPESKQEKNPFQGQGQTHKPQWPGQNPAQNPSQSPNKPQWPGNKDKR